MCPGTMIFKEDVSVCSTVLQGAHDENTGEGLFGGCSLSVKPVPREGWSGLLHIVTFCRKAKAYLFSEDIGHSLTPNGLLMICAVLLFPLILSRSFSGALIHCYFEQASLFLFPYCNSFCL